MPVSRISNAFLKAKAAQRSALVAYVMVGDPDLETSLEVIRSLRDNGADIIEIGAPFTDPMADGPAIQKAGQRSLAAGTKLSDVLSVARRFREDDTETPLILMGYANPVHHLGEAVFAKSAHDAGIDGTIIVDLPPEEDATLRDAYAPYEMAVIRMATPTTDGARMKAVSDGASGFLYYVSVTGVTGARQAKPEEIAPGIEMARQVSHLPICVGFGIKTPEQVKAMAEFADGIVVGSAFVELIREAHESGSPETAAEKVGALAAKLSAALEKKSMMV